MKIFIFLLLLYTRSLATDVILTWTANDPSEQVTEYRLYEQSSGIWIPIGQSIGTSFTVTSVTTGKHTYSVTAINMWGESAQSNPAQTPAVSTSPKNVIVKLSK